MADGERLPICGPRGPGDLDPQGTPPAISACMTPTAGVLLTGDHLLPRIRPQISVLSTRDADPLTATTWPRWAGPGASGPTRRCPPTSTGSGGLGGRPPSSPITMTAAREILQVIGRLGQPTAWAIASQLTWSRGWLALHGMMRRMALGETVAHLNYLATTRAVRPGDGPPLRWTRA